MTMNEEKIKKVFVKNIQYYLEKKDFTQRELAKFVGVSNTTVNNWVNGYSMPRMNKVDLICSFFGISRSDLLEDNPPTLYDTYDNILPITTKKIPLLGEIACGEPIYADQDLESYVEVGANIHADFALRAKGDSMIGARINDGDLVFIRKQPMVANGEIAAVIIDDEATLKRIYYQTGEHLVLQAENPAYQPLVYENCDLDQIHILGKAIAFQSDVL
ncbi:MAG: S24 family peptidase [Clostridiales bacterium]|nr:S24 family peptidase [Clostridiales bacterium]